METAIQIQNVWKIFGNNSKEALDAIQNKNISKQEALEKYNSVIGVSNVSFDVNKGEIFCVMGLSGSGKSTFLNMIGLLDSVTDGSIEIEGKDVSELSDNELSKFRGEKIGFIFQSFFLLPGLTAQENVAEGLLYQGISRLERLEKAN